MKQYQAYGMAGSVVDATPRRAAAAYFSNYPKSRKCDVIEGVQDGHFFTVTYGKASEGKWPSSYKGVTKGTLNELPD